MPNLLVTGKSGRMGQAVIEAAAQAQVAVAATHDAGEDLESAISKATCAIDFTIHSFTTTLVEAAVKHGTSLVIGTTGHTDAQVAAIKHSAAHIPLVFASNYSVGMNTLFWLTRKAAEILGPGFDLEVVEMHHRLKKDAPSGTAKKLAEILAEGRQLQYNDDVRHGRHGIVGERTDTEIGMHAVRGGDVVGDHTVIYAAQGERVELTHKASSRETFARGALRAALWAHGQPAGLYDMQDVLGLE